MDQIEERRTVCDANPTSSRAILVDGARFPSIAGAVRELVWATRSGLGQAVRAGKPYKGHDVRFAPEPEREPIWKDRARRA